MSNVRHHYRRPVVLSDALSQTDLALIPVTLRCLGTCSDDVLSLYYVCLEFAKVHVARISDIEFLLAGPLMVLRYPSADPEFAVLGFVAPGRIVKPDL